MTSFFLVLDNVNLLASIVLFLMVAALAARGVRRLKRWPLALIASSIGFWTLLVVYERVDSWWQAWNETPFDWESTAAKQAELTRLGVTALTLLAVGLALEIAALVRGLKSRLTSPIPTSPSSTSAGE